MEDPELLDWAQEVTGDAAIPATAAYAEALAGLDWRGADREFAAQLVQEVYWLPRTPPTHRHFYPRGSSRVGFLGWGEDLDTVLQTDAAILAALQITPQALGDALKRLLDSYIGAVTELSDDLSVNLDPQERERRIDDHLLSAGCTTHSVSARIFRGYQQCPFPGCVYARRFCPHSHLDFVITDRRTGEKIGGPGLIWHLIGEHGFFEGLQSTYRVEPERLVRTLNRV